MSENINTKHTSSNIACDNVQGGNAQALLKGNYIRHNTVLLYCRHNANETQNIQACYFVYILLNIHRTFL